MAKILAKKGAKEKKNIKWKQKAHKTRRRVKNCVCRDTATTFASQNGWVDGKALRTKDRA